jgi:hypothetical protein
MEPTRGEGAPNVRPIQRLGFPYSKPILARAATTIRFPRLSAIERRGGLYAGGMLCGFLK